MKLLITGGAGFMGSDFIRYWLEAYPEDEIINLDKLTYAGNLNNLREVADNHHYTFIKGDIGDGRLVDRLMDSVDVVVHFAAETHVDRSIRGAQVFLQTNVLGTQVLLDAALKSKLKRFHHISSDEVFGDMPFDSSEKFNEETPYRPSSPYAASKAAADHLVRAYHRTYGLPITITNGSNNYGPYQFPEKFLARLITRALDNQSLPVYGEGKNIRDWLYVRDHTLAVERVLTQGKVGETYCVGGQSERQNLEVAKIILKLLGKSEEKVEFVKDRPGHDRRYATDITKIKTTLSWQPQHTLEEWLEKTIMWYKDNEWWWRPLKQKAEELYQNWGK